MNVTNDHKLRKEIDLMINHIIRELIVEFGKSKTDAIRLLEKSKVEKSLVTDPMGFHESPYNWALSILTDNNDVEALEKHLYH
jgi:UDP-N-acetylglucosamine transferase subunit ALG13